MMIKKKVFRIKYLSLLFFITVFGLSCNKTMKDVYINEDLPFAIKGTVKKIDSFKGGNTTLGVLKFSNNSIDYIGLDERFRMGRVKIGDYFEKKANSNKCLIQRKDSLILIDCYQLGILKYYLGDSTVNSIEKWDRNIVNHWQLINETLTIKKLME